MTHILHQYRPQQPGEGELRTSLAEHPGTDYVVVEYNYSGNGWKATVYRVTLGGTVMAARAWGETHKTKRAAVAEAKSSGIPFMPGWR